MNFQPNLPGQVWYFHVVVPVITNTFLIISLQFWRNLFFTRFFFVKFFEFYYCMLLKSQNKKKLEENLQVMMKSNFYSSFFFTFFHFYSRSKTEPFFLDSPDLFLKKSRHRYEVLFFLIYHFTSSISALLFFWYIELSILFVFYFASFCMVYILTLS